MKTTRHNKSGFSLVEVALALLVVSVGLIAAVGMLPGGLDNSKKATDETQQALLADYVLNTFRAYAGSTNWQGGAASWHLLPTTSVPVPAQSMWDAPMNLAVSASQPPNTPVGNNKADLSFMFTPAGYGQIHELDMCYDLVFQDMGNNIERVVLQTWPALKASAGSITNRTFIADMYRGDLLP